jgi:hypothetical protein
VLCRKGGFLRKLDLLRKRELFENPGVLSDSTVFSGNWGALKIGSFLITLKCYI